MKTQHTKEQLLGKVQSLTNESLIEQLLEIILQHEDPIGLSTEQHQLLDERIKLLEEGKATYYNARETAEEIKRKLNGL